LILQPVKVMYTTVNRAYLEDLPILKEYIHWPFNSC